MKRSTRAPQPRHPGAFAGRRAAVAACVAICGLVFMAACGKKGPPLAPIVHIPAAPDQVVLRTRAGHVAFQFRVPSANSDGSAPADIRRVDVYGYTGTPEDEEAIVEGGTLVASIPVREPPRDESEEQEKPATPRPPASMAVGFDQGQTVVVFEELGPEQHRLVVPERDEKREPVEPAASLAAPVRSPAAGSAKTRTYVAVGVGRKGRRGAFSPRSLAPLEPASSAPPRPKVSYDEKQVTASWEPPADLRRPTLKIPPAEGSLDAKPLGMPSSADGFNVYLRRSDAPGAEVARSFEPSAPSPDAASASASASSPGARVTAADLGTPLNSTPLDEPRFEEPIEAFGTERCYEVTTVSRFGEATVESEPSPVACVDLIDKFAPAAPAGLVAVGSAGAINLIWTPNSEADLEGYFVLRSEGDVDPVALTQEPVKPSTYRDETVKPGVRYVYVVVAADTAGNRSGFSNRAEESAR